MYGEDIFYFKDGPPTRESILAKVKEISGLGDLTIDSQTEEFWSLMHPDFTIRKFTLYEQKSNVHIGRGWNDKWYLLDVTLNALSNLGGKTESPIPSSGGKRWILVKHLYQYPPPVPFQINREIGEALDSIALQKWREGKK